jgi:uncharacterized repeat protein (TIGR03803 family)
MSESTSTAVKFCIWLLFAVSVMPAQQTGSELVLHNFASPLPKGAQPYSGVIRDAAGNLYGTTSAGGASGEGEVYRLSSAGLLTVIHSFTGGPDGAQPFSGVVADSLGTLYGTTYTGGVLGMGVVYKIDQTGKLTVLYSFTGGADGGLPYAGVILDAAGNLYGTTYAGGISCAPFGEFPHCGVVYKVDPSGNETVLYSFSEYSGTGYEPRTGVVRDAAGNLYGAAAGGAFEQGVVYKVDVNGVETVLRTFTQPNGGDTGTGPDSSLILDAAGNLYGTTFSGGHGFPCCGTIYEVTQFGGGREIFAFDGTNGENPLAGVILDAQGNFYGTTAQGGGASGGVVYKVDSSGVETVLYNFTGGTDGGDPQSGLIRDPQGNLYGTTLFGGAGNVPEGVIYKVDVTGLETVLYTFDGKSDGANPGEGGLTSDSAGNFYGATSDGGNLGLGVIYKLNATGQESVQYNFTGTRDGAHPQGEVISDASGYLYGTTSQGGTLLTGGIGKGVIYQYTSFLVEEYTFTGGSDGGTPKSGVIRDSTGALYGTTSEGGTADQGVVYKLFDGETVLHSFTGGADGGVPEAGVIMDDAGNLYGTTTKGGTAGYGVVYKLDSTGQETVLHSFLGGADGAVPIAGVIRDAAGNLYGTTAGGGAGRSGVVYKVNADGVETVLYSFTGGMDGGEPRGGVIADASGNLCGTTSSGGLDGKGVVYKLDTKVVETVLYSFTGPDGAFPISSLIFDAAGNLYGTTRQGGKRLGGVIFELKVQ